MTTLDTTIRILADLVAFPTVSTDSNLACIRHLADLLEACGARTEIMVDASGAKANLWATIGPEGDGGIVLSGHTDVVPVADQDWTSDPFELVERDGLLFGRGTCDMKGFVAAAVAVAPQFAARKLTRPVHFAFTYDEETGCLGGQALVDILRARGVRPSMALVGEPTSMRIIEGHKGCYEYTTHFTGLEGHGSSPDLGVNAVEYAVRYVARLLDLRDTLKGRAPEGSRFDPPWTTINTGALVGGVAHNVIPGKARIDWEMRPVQAADANYVKADLHRYCADTLLPAMQAVNPKAAIHTETIAEVVGLEPTERNTIRDLVAELTGANGADVVPFGTEAGLFQGLGMDVIVCGPGAIAQAHKPDEFVAIDQLAACVDLLERLAVRLS